MFRRDQLLPCVSVAMRGSSLQWWAPAPLCAEGLISSSALGKQKVFKKSLHTQTDKVSAYDTAFLFGLAASDGFLLYVHQVTVHAGPARKRRHNPVRVAVFALLAPEGLPVEHLAVLHRHLAVPVGAHLVGQLGHGEESLKHLVHVGVLLRRDLEVGAVLVSADQLLDLLLLHLAVKVLVALVAADDQRDVHVLLGFVPQTGLGLVDLALEALHLLEGVSVIQTEHQDEHITWRTQEGKTGSVPHTTNNNSNNNNNHIFSKSANSAAACFKSSTHRLELKVSSSQERGDFQMCPKCPAGKRLPLCCRISYESPQWWACTGLRTSRSETERWWPSSQLWWSPGSPSCGSSWPVCRTRSLQAAFS